MKNNAAMEDHWGNNPRFKAEQEQDDLTIAYMAGLSRGKDLTPQRTWVGLTLDERLELAQDVDWAAGAYCEYAEKVEAKLKEKNT